MKGPFYKGEFPQTGPIDSYNIRWRESHQEKAGQRDGERMLR